MLEGYEGREQSAVKHEILKKYLLKFAIKVGSKWPSITYIDGFSGPWSTQADDLSDASFSIALNELRRARDTHQASGKKLAIRCVFVEKKAEPYRRLKEFADSVSDAEIHTIHGGFEDAVPEIIDFVKQDSDTFPFTLIDPTGSTGFKMKAIAPLLQLKPGEVLITFMLEFIRRYILHEELKKGLVDLFGTEDFDENLANLTHLDRDDAICIKYCECLKKFCNFPYVLRASILHPDKDRLYFQLVYGTRSDAGVKVFKDVEKSAMKLQENSRAHLEVERKNQPLFDPDDMPESKFYEELRTRYMNQANDVVNQLVFNNPSIPYDDLWKSALHFPMVWESDLRQWLTDWKEQGIIKWEGLKEGKRTLKYGHNHSIAKKA